MKKFYLLPALVFFFSLQSFAQKDNFESASEYNNFIVGEQSRLIKKIVEYNIQTVHSDDYNQNNIKRLEIINQIDVSIEKLKALSSWNGDSKMKDEALGVFRLYKEAYDIEFNEVNLLRKDRESSYEAMEKYFKAQDKAEEKLKYAGEKFMKAQQDFAKKNKMTLKAGDSDNHMNNIAQVNQYSRNIFIEFFRISKIDGAFLDALNNQKTSLMEEKRKLLLEATNTALANIKKIIPYNSDNEYKEKAIELAHYHKSIAEKEYLDLVRIIGKKSGMTQEDVNRYNEIVNYLNEKTQKLIEEFNKANRDMMKRNIPMN
jgi:hypothetical protein